MSEHEQKDKSPEAKDALSEGMGQAIGGLEMGSAELTDFLGKVITEFRDESPGATLREAARIVIEREGLDQYTEAIPEIQALLKIFLGGKNTDWEEMVAEDAKRALRDDKTLGGTPG